MSFLLECPRCGSRPVDEFAYFGEVTRRPKGSASLRELTDYVYFRENVAGVQREWWQHRAGCGEWFLAERDTRTNEVLAIQLPQPERQPAPGPDPLPVLFQQQLLQFEEPVAVDGLGREPVRLRACGTHVPGLQGQTRGGALQGPRQLQGKVQGAHQGRPQTRQGGHRSRFQTEAGHLHLARPAQAHVTLRPQPPAACHQLHVL